MTPPSLDQEMLWHDYAPSRIAEQVLANCDARVMNPAPPSARQDRAGLEYHLRSNGAGEYFSINEIVTPNHRDKARACGYSELVPPGHCWGVVTLVVWLADRLREAADSPAAMRNLWRPQSYNSKVASSGIDSDHPNACGADLDFGSAAAREKAEDWLADWITETGNSARVSVGLGGQTLHVGVLSPNGSRHWKYESYSSSVNPVFAGLAWNRA